MMSEQMSEQEAINILNELTDDEQAIFFSWIINLLEKREPALPPPDSVQA